MKVEARCAWVKGLIGAAAAAVVLLGAVGCRRQPRANKPSEASAGTSSVETTISGAAVGPTLAEIIASRKTWDVAFQSLAGKPAPDLRVTDLTGKVHTISGYKGRQVLVVIWAPWCAPCRMEIPDLVELRKAVPEDRLAMLAISFLARNNTQQMVRQFVEQDGTINYTVAVADVNSVPGPYSQVEGIPSAFFIGRDGTLKLATLGPVPLADMLAIIKAE